MADDLGGWEKLIEAATQTTLVELERMNRKVHDSIMPVPPIDELYDDDNYGPCDMCEEMHVLCPICGFCLKYCHDPQTCGIPCWPEDD